MDETGMPVDPKPLKTIQCKGEKNQYQQGVTYKHKSQLWGVLVLGVIPTTHGHLG